MSFASGDVCLFGMANTAHVGRERDRKREKDRREK